MCAGRSRAGHVGTFAMPGGIPCQVNRLAPSPKPGQCDGIRKSERKWAEMEGKLNFPFLVTGDQGLGRGHEAHGPNCPKLPGNVRENKNPEAVEQQPGRLNTIGTNA